jgi:hypothetical protein
MAWWTLLPAAAGMVTTAINKPKREDYKTDVSSYQRYIANLYNQVGKRDVYRQAMEPALRSIGQAQRGAERGMNYELARQGLGDSGVGVQARLSAQDRYLQAVQEASGQAMQQEGQFRRQAQGQAMQTQAQIGQIKAQDKQQYERARSQWGRDMIGAGIGLGAQAAAIGGQQWAQNRALAQATAAEDLIEETFTPQAPAPEMSAPEATTSEAPKKAPPPVSMEVAEPPAGMSREQHLMAQTATQEKAVQPTPETPATETARPATGQQLSDLTASEFMARAKERIPDMTPETQTHLLSRYVDKKAEMKGIKDVHLFGNTMQQISEGKEVNLESLNLPADMYLKLKTAQISKDPQIMINTIKENQISGGGDWKEEWNQYTDPSELSNVVTREKDEEMVRLIESPDSKLSDVFSSEILTSEEKWNVGKMVSDTKKSDKSASPAFTYVLENYDNMTRDEITRLYSKMDYREIKSVESKITSDEQKELKGIIPLEKIDANIVLIADRIANIEERKHRMGKGDILSIVESEELDDLLAKQRQHLKRWEQYREYSMLNKGSNATYERFNMVRETFIKMAAKEGKPPREILEEMAGMGINISPELAQEFMQTARGM